MPLKVIHVQADEDVAESAPARVKIAARLSMLKRMRPATQVAAAVKPDPVKIVLAHGDAARVLTFTPARQVAAAVVTPDAVKQFVLAHGIASQRAMQAAAVATPDPSKLVIPGWVSPLDQRLTFAPATEAPAEATTSKAAGTPAQPANTPRLGLALDGLVRQNPTLEVKAMPPLPDGRNPKSPPLAPPEEMLRSRGPKPPHAPPRHICWEFAGHCRKKLLQKSSCRSGHGHVKSWRKLEKSRKCAGR